MRFKFTNRKTLLFLIGTASVVLVVSLVGWRFGNAPAPIRAGAGDNVSGYAWSDNIGWISFNNIDPGTGVSYGVNINPATGNFSGYAWANPDDSLAVTNNIGWIRFDPPGPYPEAPNYSAKLDAATNKVTGWARACAGTVNGDCASASRTDGWDGWIKMAGAAIDSSPYGVSRSGCNLLGYAWGSDVVGWISFNGTAPSYGVTLAPAACEGESLSVALATNPSSGTAPLKNVVLTADVSGTAGGPINYTFYCNRSDSGTNITFPADHQSGGTNTDPYSAPAGICNSVYANPGTYAAKVIVQRGTAPAAEARAAVTIIAPPVVSLTVNGSATPIKIGEGQSVNIDWTSTNADSCTASGGSSGWPGSGRPSQDQTGAYTYTPGPGLYTYTIQCIGPGGTSQPDSVAVDVVGPALSLAVSTLDCTAVNLLWSWNDPIFNNQFSRYNILRSDDNFNFSQRAVVDAPAMSYADHDSFGTDVTYYYKIEALRPPLASVFSNAIEAVPCSALPTWHVIEILPVPPVPIR